MNTQVECGDVNNTSLWGESLSGCWSSIKNRTGSYMVNGLVVIKCFSILFEHSKDFLQWCLWCLWCSREEVHKNSSIFVKKCPIFIIFQNLMQHIYVGNRQNVVQVTRKVFVFFLLSKYKPLQNKVCYEYSTWNSVFKFWMWICRIIYIYTHQETVMYNLSIHQIILYMIYFSDTCLPCNFE